MKLRATLPVRHLGLILGALGISAAVSAQPAATAAPVIPPGTVIAIRTIDAIESKTADSAKEYKATVDDDVVVGGVTVARAGAPAFLRVTEVQKAGAVKGRTAISLRLAAIEISGKRVNLDTGDATIRSGSQAGKATKAGVGGAVAGGIIGGLLGGKGGAASGVAAGGAIGVTAAAVSGQKVHVAAETRLSFTVSAATEGSAPANAGERDRPRF
jgi:hypothetical protein